MNTSPFRGADALIHVLKHAGVRQLFTLSGNHIMPVFDAAYEAGIPLIHTRHEAATVHMADAWGRLTGEPGIALVTGGPGHANALSALYTAQMAESPLVLLSGHAPVNQAGLGAFQEMRQSDLAAPLTKASWTSRRADDLPHDLARAMRIAREGRPGPVHVSLPSDLLVEPVAREALPDATSTRPTAMPLAAATATDLLEQLAGARQPLILVGPAGLHHGMPARLQALEAASGVPVIAMESPRGIQDPSLGAFGSMLAQADRVLLLGKRLDFTLRFGRGPAFRDDSLIWQVDAEAEVFAHSRRCIGSRLLHTAQADLGSALDALTAAAQRSTPRHATWRAAVHDAVQRRPAGWQTATASTPDRLHPAQALLPLRAVLDEHPESVFVSDGGEFGQWAQACLHAPNRVINGVAGAIGSALPFALAARLARPDAPVIAVLGDGTFGFHAAEIDTAVRHQLPFVAIVGNDARWNAEYQIQLREYGAARTIGCDLLPTRYDQVTAGFGGFGDCVTDADELLPAVRRAMGCGLPACVNVMIEGLAAPTV